MSAVQVVEQENSAMIRPVAQLAAVVDLHKQIDKFIQTVLVKGVDYIVIPGTDKPTLSKSGAEKTCKYVGCYVTYEIIEQQLDHVLKFPWKKQRWDKYKRAYVINEGESYGCYSYTVKASLFGPQDQKVAECIGVCSTMESKYVDRPRDCQNTVLKMAQKRAKVGVVIEGLALSQQFTQDVEDDEGDKAETGEAARPQASGFNPKDAVQLKWLEDQLTKHKVSREDWPVVKEEMNGKTSDKLAEVIKQVCGTKT